MSLLSYFAGLAALSVTPPLPAGPAPWFTFDSRNAGSILTSGVNGSGYPIVTGLADAGGGQIQLDGYGADAALLLPPDTAHNNVRPVYAAGTAAFRSSMQFPADGSHSRSFYAVLLTENTTQNLFGHGSEASTGKIFDMLEQSGPVAGIHYFGNNPATQGGSMPFDAYSATLIAVRYSEPLQTVELTVGGNGAVVATPVVLTTSSGLLYLAGGGFSGLNGTAPKYLFYFRAYTEWLPDANHNALCASLRAAFNAV